MKKDKENKGKYWDRAWSLVEGCTPVSEACDNCWLAAIENRFGHKLEKGITGTFADGTATGYERKIQSPFVNIKGQFNSILPELFKQKQLK